MNRRNGMVAFGLVALCWVVIFLTVSSRKAAETDCLTAGGSKAGCRYLRDTSWMTIHFYEPHYGTALFAGAIMAIATLWAGYLTVQAIRTKS